MKSKLKRIGWLSLVVLFVGTGLGIGVWGFLDAINQKDQPAPETASQSEQCAIDTVQGAETLPDPKVYKPTDDVKELGVTDLEEGTGDTVEPGDCITVKYHGTLATTGVVFDGNFGKAEALKMPIGAGQLIQGWDQGIPGMKVGGTRQLVIPSELAYGEQGSESIPPNSDLVFVVKVLDAK